MWPDAVLQAGHAGQRHGYAQEYDLGGHPINPASRDHGRRMRQAQNDVLAAVGVVERRAADGEHVPREAHDTAADDHQPLPDHRSRDTSWTERAVVSLFGTLDVMFLDLGTWWASCLRRRLEVRDGLRRGHWRCGANSRQAFDAGSPAPLSQLVAAGLPEMLYAGLPAYLIAVHLKPAWLKVVDSCRPLDSVLFWTGARKKAMEFRRRWKRAISCWFVRRLDWRTSLAHGPGG